MKWSIQELFKNIKIIFKRRYSFIDRVFYFLFDLLKSINVFIIWIFTGVGIYTEDNLDYFITEILIYRLKKYYKNIDKKQGYPGFDEADTFENWKIIIEKIILGFESYKKLSDGEDNPYVKFDYNILYRASKNNLVDIFHAEEILLEEDRIQYDKYREAQREWEASLQENHTVGMKLYSKYFSSFWG